VISVIQNDGSKSYQSKTDGTDIQIASCQAYFRNTVKTVRARIRYEGNTNSLYVWTDSYHDDNWVQCVEVHDVMLPAGYYFGVSAATGDLSDNHDIYSFTTYDPSGGKGHFPTIVQPPQFTQPEQQTQEQKPAEQQEPPKQQDEQNTPPDYTAILDKLQQMQATAAKEKEDLNQPQTSTHSADGSQTATTLDQEYIQRVLSSTMESIQRLDEQLTLVAEAQKQVIESTVSDAYLRTELQALETRVSASNAAASRSIELLNPILRELKEAATRVSGMVQTQANLISSMKSQAEALSKESRGLAEKIGKTADITVKTIESRTSFGFWAFFTIFQVAIIAAIFIWKKLKDEIANKLF